MDLVEFAALIAVAEVEEELSVAITAEGKAQVCAIRARGPVKSVIRMMTLAILRLKKN